MDSRSYDPSLPLDFDGSSNMLDLPEVTLGGNPSSQDLSKGTSHHTLSPGSGLLFPNVVKSTSGRMSPVRGRTMKEYDQQITDLKKENFSLKLRIYFLEECMQRKYGDGEDVFKTNIEMKVNVQSLKKELEDKQELLRKASQAMETLTSSQQSDIDSVRKSLEEQHHKYTEELRSDLQKALQDAEDAREEMEEGRERMNQLEIQIQQLETEHHHSQLNTQKLQDVIEMKEREISALQLESDSQERGLHEAQRLLQEAETERDAAQNKVQQMEKDLQRRGRDVEQLSTALKDTSMIDGHSFLAPSHLQDVVDDQRDDLDQLQAKVKQLEGQLREKDDLIGTLEEEGKEREKGLKDATNQLQQLTLELDHEKQLGGRRDKTIQGLVSNLHKKAKEVTSAKARLSKSEGALKTLRAELHEAEMTNHQDELDQAWEQLKESENSNRRLQTQLTDANLQVENMIKSLGKKEGELAGFREQLDKANQALKRSEEALEGLQEQLEKERKDAHHRLDQQTQEFQRTSEDYMQQLQGKDSLMANMTSQLRAKDQQLSSLMDLLTDDTNKGQKVLQRLEDDLNQSTGHAQSALEEKQAELDRKGKELRDTRQALHDKGRELEQVQLQLLDKQEELEKLELRNRQQGEATAQLSRTLAKAQQCLEEALERHGQALQDKDTIVNRLQKALAEKERMIEELSQASPSTDKQQQQLRAQLREKEQLVQELQTDCVKAACEREQAARKSQAQLMDKEEEILALNKKQQKDLLNRDQELQRLQSELARKEMEVEGGEARLAEALHQHKEALNTLHTALAHKDSTIQALVDSVGEKERLLRRSQQNLTEDAKAQIAEMDTLMADNARLKRLLREKEDALQEALHQRNRHDNRESHHTSYHETVTHSNNTDNAQVCRLLEQQIRETHALSELLRQDRHQVLVNLTSDHRHSDTHSREEGARPSSEEALQAELSAVSALRQRLQDGVEKHQQLHRSLLGHTARYADHVTSGESSPETGSDCPLLNIPANRSYPQHQQQHQQHQQQKRQEDQGGDEVDGCPGLNPSLLGSESRVWGHRLTADASHTPDVKARGSSSLAVQTSPFLTHGLFEQGGPLSRPDTVRLLPSPPVLIGAGEGETSHTQLLERSVSQDQALAREWSHDSVLSSLSSLSSAQLAGMSAPVLRDLVSQLQEDLITTAQHNAALTRQLQAQGQGQGTEGAGGSTMENGEMSTSEELHAQVESLKTTLKLKEAETTQLREHLGLSDPQTSIDPPSPAHLHQQVRNLRHQVKDMNKVNDTLKQAVNGKSPANPEGFDPQQLVNMALEIERLKADNARLTSQIKKPEAGDVRMENGVREVALPGDEYDGNGALGEDAVFAESAQSPDSMLSPLSPQLSAESFSQELSRNTNRHTDSSVSQISNGHPWSSTFGRSISQSSQSEMEWVPRMMREGNTGSKLPPLAKMKLNGKETTAGSQPLINVSRRLQDSQQQVRLLEDRLMATEGTVRFMSKRLRHFRSLLQAGKAGGDSKTALAGYGLPRSQSESSIFPQAGLSLSLSCSDLREAAGGMGGVYGSSTDLVSMATQGGGAAQPSVVSSEGQRGQGGPSRPHAILDTLNQHIKAMKNKYPQLGEPGKSTMAQAGGNHSHTQLEEDGGSNMSCLSSQHSRENLRRDILPCRDVLDRQTSRTSKDTAVMSDNTTNITMSEASNPDWSVNSRQTVGAQGNSAVSPQEVTVFMTLGDDLPDCTAMDNLTYSSFSESILPLGSSQGHHDSAWSLPSGVSAGRRREARELQTSKLDHSPENTEPGSSGDEATFDGNRLSQSNTTGEDSVSHNESSRLKTRLMVLTDMNRTLREELNVYDTLCRSLGVQVSAEGTGVGESGEESCDGEMRLLQLHLAELKRLRARLEQLDTDAHNAVQVTSLLNNQHIRRISQLEAALQHLKDQLAQKQALADHRETLIFEHERVISETRVLQEHQEKETQLLRDNLAALQDCEQQRKQQQEAEVAELAQQVESLRTDLDDARRQVKDLEEELEESQQHRQSYDVRFTQSQQHLQDIEDELSRAKRRAKSLEAELHKSQLSCQDLQSRLSSAKSKMNTLDDDLRLSRQSCKKLEFEVKKSTQVTAVMESKLTRTEEEKVLLQEDLSSSQENLQSAEEELTQLRQHTEELNLSLQKEKGRADKLQSQLDQVRAEKGEVEDLASRSQELQEECRQQQQRTQHYQERMAHYEQCMRDYQHRVHECEAQVGQLKSSLESSQSREQDTDGRLHHALSQVQQLQGQVKDAESRAHTNQSLAHRADTLAKTLEGRLRELEAKVKESEERCKECEYELRISQTTLSESTSTVETMKKEAGERSTKLKKRDAQLKKLVDEYKKVVASQKETSQLNKTLKTEIKLYESMTSQTEVSRDKKEELMRQLLSELSQTRRLAEDLISRLEHNKRNDSPASTAGPEAADGRPSPEPRDSVHSLLSESNILRVHTDTHTSLTASHASSSSERTETQQSQSSVSTPLSSPGSGTFSLNAARPSTLLQEGEASRRDTSAARSSSSKTDWLREGSGQDAGQGHLRSYSHPVSLKYWRDHPMSSLAGSSGGPKVEVDSDVRRLFAISGLEGYEKLKRENTELLSTLSAMQARTAERLKAFTGISISESVEYSTLRELQMSAQNLRICAEEESRLLGCFWLTQLPPLNARGEFYDPKLADEAESLKVELRKQKSRYDLLAHTVREQQERLHATNALRKKWETTLYKQLTHTNGMLERSKENFDEAGLTPPKSKSPRKPGSSGIKDKN